MAMPQIKLSQKTVHVKDNFESYTQEKMLNSLCNWLGTSHSGQTSHCHMQVLIPNNLAYVLYHIRVHYLHHSDA